MNMSADWEYNHGTASGRLTLFDGRYIILRGADAESFDSEWDGASEANKEEILNRLVGGKTTIHYPPQKDKP